MQIPLKQILCATFVVTALLLPITGQAATYYVAPTGNDANTCTQAKSASTPKKTIQTGVTCLVGGDTLIVKAGTYINQGIRNPPAGTASAYTVIKGDPSGPRPVLKPNASAAQRGFYCSRGETCRYIEMRYFEVASPYEYLKLDGTDTIGYSHHLRIIDNVFHDSKASGFLISSSVTGFRGGDHLIQGNRFYRTGSGTPNYGPGFNTIYNPGNRTVVERNTFHNAAHGVGIWRTGSEGPRDIQKVIVRNNTFYDMGRTTIDPWQKGATGYTAIRISVPGGGHQIYNNIVHRSGDTYNFTAMKVQMYGSQARINASAPIHFYNNTIYDLKHTSAHAIHILPNMGGPHLVKNNIVYLAGRGINGGIQSNNQNTNPSFRNVAGADFRLLGNSTAIDKGVILSAVPTDFSGARRPAGSSHDIGAYETGATSALAAPTSLSSQ